MTDRPNILLFMVDQLTSFVLSAYGGKVCKTPHIDALAARGTVFENAYCAYPLCAPSRFGMMAGRLPSRIGAYDNGAEFTASTPTFAHYLRLHGYYTCISGKMHFVGPDQFHGFEERLTTEIYPADMSWTPDADFRDFNKDEERAYTFGVSTIDTVRDAGPVARSMQIDYDEDVIHHAIRELYTRARGEDARPFLMTVSLTHPHDPYVITRDYWDRYEDGEIDAPRVPHIPVETRDPHSQSLYYHYGQDKCDLSEADYRNARRGYYGMISYVDDLFGRLMKALADSGYAENTVIIFASDHGDMIGERGMWFKKTLFDPAIQVPLIIAHPGCEARRIAAPVSLLDLFPTILDMAGITGEQIKTPLDGRSLTPALRGEEIDGPVYVEHIDGGTSAPRVCVRDGMKKLVISRAYPPQFYDLSKDPLERQNNAGKGDPDEARLAAMAEAAWPLDTLLGNVISSQVARKLIDTALATGREEIWDFTPRPLRQNSNYVRRGDAFPTVERRGYLHYKQ
ncbi:choline-sulfatase [Defluviimonas sp. WL0002]|uniref:Choline-sulfatase n=1 Tax=Albidovulum marisflavi TaxID=2984159 RepID=A0ABT2Z8J1_9RHOB|nr:choline-sulfatase [Defluviimonas sp. WL0002]MCV2867447.1 choline-sulfatase [Defluviimonas sp. WL0002]